MARTRAARASARGLRGILVRRSAPTCRRRYCPMRRLVRGAIGIRDTGLGGRPPRSCLWPSAHWTARLPNPIAERPDPARALGRCACWPRVWCCCRPPREASRLPGYSCSLNTRRRAGPTRLARCGPPHTPSGLKRPDRNAREPYRPEGVMSIQSSLSALHPGSSSRDSSPSTRSTKRTTFLAL